MAQQEPPVTEAAQPAQPQPAGRSKERLGSVLILTGVILLVLVAAGWGWLWWSQRDERAARVEAVAVAEAERQVIDHIHRWAEATVESRRTVDLKCLDGIYEPGGEFERSEAEILRDLQRQQLRVEFTREIRSIDVKVSSRDRVAAVVLWEDSRYELVDIRTGKPRFEADGERTEAELEVRLVGGRWLITDLVFLKREPLVSATSTTAQSASDEADVST